MLVIMLTISGHGWTENEEISSLTDTPIEIPRSEPTVPGVPNPLPQQPAGFPTEPLPSPPPPSGRPLDTPVSPQAVPQKPVTSMIVPMETVLYIRLSETLSSESAQVGAPISAVIDQPLNLGPYTVIPEGSQVQGQITHVNNQLNNDGYNPYVVIHFDKLKRLDDPDFIPFDGRLIAYKSGLTKQDYVWRLPKPGDRKRSHIKSVVGGALSGALFNPIFGPPLGAGAGLLKSMLTNRVAHGGQVNLTPEKPLPISVNQPFLVPMTAAAMAPLQQPVETTPPESTLYEVIPDGQLITK